VILTRLSFAEQNLGGLVSLDLLDLLVVYPPPDGRSQKPLRQAQGVFIIYTPINDLSS